MGGEKKRAGKTSKKIDEKKKYEREADSR